MSAIHQQIEALRDRFVSGLPDRIGAISRLLLRVHSEPLEAPVLETIGRQLHSLAGTAATYNLLEIASLAAEGEAVCRRGISLTPGDLDYLGSLVHQLHDATGRQP